MKTYNFITLILILTIIGCASSFSKRTSKRTIKLKKLNPSETKIGFENDKAIVKFEKSDIIELILKDYDKYPTHYKKEELEKIKNLTSDSIINEIENKINNGSKNFSQNNFFKNGKNLENWIKIINHV